MIFRPQPYLTLFTIASLAVLIFLDNRKMERMFISRGAGKESPAASPQPVASLCCR